MANMTPGVIEDGDEKVTTVIADDLEIKGTVKFESSLMTKGVIEGEIISNGLLIVGPTAKVSATITTKNLVSHGVVEGDITASERAVLKKSAVYTGNITTPSIIIESGCLFNGACVMQKRPVEEAPQVTAVEPEPEPAQETAVEAASLPETESVEQIPEEQPGVETEAAEEHSEIEEEYGKKKEEEEEKEESGSFWSRESEGRSKNPELF